MATHGRAGAPAQGSRPPPPRMHQWNGGSRRAVMKKPRGSHSQVRQPPCARRSAPLHLPSVDLSSCVPTQQQDFFAQRQPQARRQQQQQHDDGDFFDESPFFSKLLPARDEGSGSDADDDYSEDYQQQHGSRDRRDERHSEQEPLQMDRYQEQQEQYQHEEQHQHQQEQQQQHQHESDERALWRRDDRSQSLRSVTPEPTRAVPAARETQLQERSPQKIPAPPETVLSTLSRDLGQRSAPQPTEGQTAAPPVTAGTLGTDNSEKPNEARPSKPLSMDSSILLSSICNGVGNGYSTGGGSSRG